MVLYSAPSPRYSHEKDTYAVAKSERKMTQKARNKQSKKTPQADTIDQFQPSLEILSWRRLWSELCLILKWVAQTV
jgi:hypothetical protein